MIPAIRLGNRSFSAFLLGSNPFSGFSHQSPAADEEMKRFYTVARLKETLRHAESLGITGLVARADHFIMRLLLEYRDEGGRIQWIAQTCPEVGTVMHGIRNAIQGGAAACYLHGGMMDTRFDRKELADLPDAVKAIRDAGIAAGMAAHNPDVHAWAADHLDLDFQVCSYYNPIPRNAAGEHEPRAEERFDPADRDRMVALIARLARPVIHYKILAAGRTPADQAFAFAARHLRPRDAVCVGVHLKHKPNMLEEDVRLFLQHISRAEKTTGLRSR